MMGPMRASLARRRPQPAAEMERPGPGSTTWAVIIFGLQLLVLGSTVSWADSIVQRELQPFDVGPTPIGATSIDVGLNYRTWSIQQESGDSSVDQFAVPVFVRTSLTKSLDFSYLFSAASSGLSLGAGEEGTLEGVTDGKLGVNYLLPGNRVSLGLGVRVPTGESVLDPQEDAVARVLNDRILGFWVKRYGEGTDVEMRGGYSAVLGRGVALAGGVSYTLKGDFPFQDPLSGVEANYEPGDELSVLVRLEARAIARDWRTQVRFATYGTDQRDGVDEIQEGSEVELGLTMAEEHLAGVLELDAGALFKQDTEIVSAEGASPVRDVGGNILRVGGGFYGKLSAASRLGGRVGASWYGEAKSGTGDGFVFEVGPRYRRQFGSAITADLAYTFYAGNAEDKTIDLIGHDVTIAFGLLAWGRR